MVVQPICQACGWRGRRGLLQCPTSGRSPGLAGERSQWERGDRDIQVEQMLQCVKPLPFGVPKGGLVSADCKRGRRKGATSKNVKNRQKVSKKFDTFRQFSHREKTSKNVQNVQNVQNVKKFFDNFRAAPFFWPLLGGSDSSGHAWGDKPTQWALRDILMFRDKISARQFLSLNCSQSPDLPLSHGPPLTIENPRNKGFSGSGAPIFGFGLADPAPKGQG